MPLVDQPERAYRSIDWQHAQSKAQCIGRILELVYTKRRARPKIPLPITCVECIVIDLVDDWSIYLSLSDCLSNRCDSHPLTSTYPMVESAGQRSRQHCCLCCLYLFIGTKVMRYNALACIWDYHYGRGCDKSASSLTQVLARLRIPLTQWTHSSADLCDYYCAKLAPVWYCNVLFSLSFALLSTKSLICTF